MAYEAIMISIALYKPEIPQNTGNIARLAVGLDIELIIIGEPSFSMDDKHVKRAGLDYWPHLKLSKIADLEGLLANSPERRIIPVTTKGTTPYYDFAFSPNDILLFGSESSGLPKDYIKKNIMQTYHTHGWQGPFSQPRK